MMNGFTKVDTTPETEVAYTPDESTVPMDIDFEEVKEGIGFIENVYTISMQKDEDGTVIITTSNPCSVTFEADGAVRVYPIEEDIEFLCEDSLCEDDCSEELS